MRNSVVLLERDVDHPHKLCQQWWWERLVVISRQQPCISWAGKQSTILTRTERPSKALGFQSWFRYRIYSICLPICFSSVVTLCHNHHSLILITTATQKLHFVQTKINSFFLLYLALFFFNLPRVGKESIPFCYMMKQKEYKVYSFSFVWQEDEMWSDNKMS